ncbi:MAG TPA: DEAD/DEAH box helicase [Bryobacteraceae bacterium]|nr:DEAD/DEAH box helicase [Bryobacteraceae bacterium]
MDSITLRPYQKEAVDAGVGYMKLPSQRHGLMVLPTGSGKSLVIANIVKELEAPCLVFQPSREILMQNFDKMITYGFRPGVYSASAGEKRVRAITLATIGSVVKQPEIFDHVKYVIVDEAHVVNPKEGMYSTFLAALIAKGVKVLGMTATPYRLSSNSSVAILRFLTRTRPRVFDDLVYYVQNLQLFKEGYLAKLEYFAVKGFDRTKLQTNSTGADYTDKSVQQHFRDLDFAGKLEAIVNRLIEIKRRGVLVFTRFVEESRQLTQRVSGAVMVSAETPSDERYRILRDFKAGRIQVVCNVGVLTTGFDYPELDTVVLARPTLSLALYYQMVGRCVRPHSSKAHSMVVDMVQLQKQFGRVENLLIGGPPNKPHVESGGIQLTNVYFTPQMRGL